MTQRDAGAGDRPVLVHIGFHKTGTSFLQQRIFEEPRHGFLSPWTVASGEAIEHFVLTHPRRFEPDGVRAAFASACAGLGVHGVPVVSHEDLCGHPRFGRYYGFEVADRLYRTFTTDGRVLIVIREQSAIVRSYFDQYVKQGGEHRIEDFLGRGRRRSGFSPIFRLDHVEYDLLVDHYVERFGPDSVLVLPQELLRTDQKRFLEHLFDFAGIDGSPDAVAQEANVSPGAFSLHLRRRLNTLPGNLPPVWHDYSELPRSYRAKVRLARRVDSFVHEGLDRRARRRVEEVVRARTAGRFHDSNRRVQQFVPVDLAPFGYFD